MRKVSKVILVPGHKVLKVIKGIPVTPGHKALKVSKVILVPGHKVLKDIKEL